ncbi:MAG TPA: UbiA family prenyltransferase [Limnobacter sp.]|uniref:UbiA family prenyltransferase n=1 Tax=Limnobacter sp. TaxID=2003368 RepID=UPI002E31853B|nr:UbiA family prenyltransferase [Limnobacter sp.]HEX5485566.1 UbiA family prenyltransferase [Limnobacter sp.]
MPSTRPPVYVDLDGTLSPSDLLLEACLQLVRLRFLNVFLLIAWALKGAWYFKSKLATCIQPDTELFPIRAGLLDELVALKAEGHRLVLATASVESWVLPIAARLGLFDAVIASRTSNLKGVRKLRAIESDAGGQPFVYYGDSAADIPVWKAAQRPVAVAPSWRTRLKAKAAGVQLEVFQAKGDTAFKVISRAMRVQQWAKNALLFLPLVAAHQLNAHLWLQMLMGFVAFGLVASATYIWNDLMDLVPDRHHPRKRLRPMASGALAPASALLLMFFLALAGFALSWLAAGGAFTSVLFAYTALTLLYTFRLKRVPFVDVLTLALLYTVRVIAGGLATGIEVSSWLLAISLFVFLSLALVKRCAELEFLQFEGVEPSGRGYRMSDLGYLVSMGISSGFVAVLVLALYVDSQNGSMLYHQPKFLWGICPIFLYWLMRIWILTSRREMIDDPVHFAIHDRVSWLVLVCMVVLAALAV